MYQTKPLCAPFDAKQLTSLAAPPAGQRVHSLTSDNRRSLILLADREKAFDLLLRKRQRCVVRSPLWDAYYWAVAALDDQIVSSVERIRDMGLLLHVGVVVSI